VAGRQAAIATRCRLAPDIALRRSSPQNIETLSDRQGNDIAL
jgi:hypothetical protein